MPKILVDASPVDVVCNTGSHHPPKPVFGGRVVIYSDGACHTYTADGRLVGQGTGGELVDDHTWRNAVAIISWNVEPLLEFL